MTNEPVSIPAGRDGDADGNPERALVIGYACATDRAGLRALLRLDDMLAQIARTTRDPLVGQMRFTWWHAALNSLDTAPPAAQPILQALAADVMPRGVSGAALATLIEGWEILVDPSPLGDAALRDHAVLRGGVLFRLAGMVLRASEADPLEAAGQGWALADLARHVVDRNTAVRAASLASVELDAATAVRWSRNGRPLGALAHLARLDLRLPLQSRLPVGAPSRVARLFWHRIAGR
ncbi:MAG: squalene/phytoene synthase family protein [Sphingomonas sp.]